MDYCPNCRTELDVGDRFCAECGYNLQQPVQKQGREIFFKKLGKKHKKIAILLIILTLVPIFLLVIWFILRSYAPGSFPLTITFGNDQSKFITPGVATKEPNAGVFLQETLTVMTLETEENFNNEEPTSSEATPTEGVHIAEEDELVYIFYDCDEEQVKSGDELAVYYFWGVLEQTQLNDYFSAADHQIRINGEQIPIIRMGYGEIEKVEGEGYYRQKYWIYIGQLDPGEFVIETTVILKEAVFDGWDWFESGESSSECLLIVE